MSWISYYRGLALNGTYLYQYYYSTYGDGFWGIARTNIETKSRTEWKNIIDTYYQDVFDISSDSEYLYLLGEICILKFNFSGDHIDNLSIDETFSRIYSDGTYLYLSNSSKVCVYTTSGVLSQTITVSDIKSVVVLSTDIYIVTSEKIKKYNSAGVFQSEFSITGDILDSIII